MIDKNIRELLFEMYKDENDDDIPTIFDNPSFDNSIIGISHDDRLVYNMDKMIEEFMKDNKCDKEDAIEFIEYNTMRTIPYIQNKPPIIIYNDILAR